MRKTFATIVLALILLCLPLLACAAVEEVGAFFRPATGVVIMPVGDEFLIDLDAAKGARVGDLLTVGAPGEKIVHPVSGEILGTLDTLKGVFQITRMKTGYSYMRPVGTAKKVERGDTVRLWEQVPAAVRIESGADAELGRRLPAALPRLDWQSERQDVPLLFTVHPGRLEVRGPGGAILHTFPLAAAPGVRPAESASPPPPAPPAAAVVTPPAAQAPIAIVRSQQSGTAGLWMSPEFSGEAVGVHVADLDADGQQEVAIAFPYRLEVGRITAGAYSRLATLDLGFGQKVVALDGADLDGDRRAELYLTAASGGELQSLAVTYAAGGLKIVEKRLPWYLRSIELPGEGRVLLGQRMGRLDEDFAGPVSRIVMREGKLATGEPLAVPPGISLFGFLPVAGESEAAAFLYLNVFDELKVVDSAGSTIWKSEETAGGSEAFIERLDPSKNPASGPANRSVFLQQRLEPVSGGYLVPVNEGRRLFSRMRSFDKSFIRAVAWNGFALQELWRTQPQGAYLADYRLADADNDGRAEIVQALVFSRDGMLSKGRSALAVFELHP